MSLPSPYPPAARTGEPVPVSEPSCAMDNIHSATEGLWNGIPVTLADMKAMADNFEKYSSGANPYYRPFVVLNHEDPLGSGILVGARFDGSELHLDADHIPQSVGAWANAKRLHGASVEFWQPKWDEAGTLIGEFMTPQGVYADTPVIRSLSLLGNQAPGMKGMADLPTARFSDTSGALPQPQEGTAVNRDQLIQALAAKGFDATKLTDLDTLLQYLVDCGAAPTATATATNPGDPAEGLNNPVPMADASGALGGVGGPAGGTGAALAVPSIMGGSGQPAPTSLTLKFNDASGKPVTGVVVLPAGVSLMTDRDRVALAQIAQRGAAAAADLARQRLHSKTAAIAAFGDRMHAAHVAPATIAAQKQVLAALDHDVTRKFADGKGTGTQLEEMIRVLEVAAVPGRNFDEKIAQPQGGGTNTNPQVHAPGGGTGQAQDWAVRRKSMLDNDPMFAKAAKTAAAKK